MIPEMEALLQKAHRSLEAARRDLAAGDTENAVSRAYYATFHAASAALLDKNLAAKSHAGMQRLFSEHFVQTGLVDEDYGRTFSRLFQDRREADYQFGSTFSMSKATGLVQEAEAFVSTIETLLSGS